MPWPSGYPKNMTPQQRIDRARNAALARNSTENHLKALVGRTLTEEQRRTLTDLLAAGAAS